MQDEQPPDLVGLSAEIVSAYVAKNHIQTSEIPQLITSVHDALRNVAKPAPEPEKHEPPVPINKTIRPDYIISLEDGRRYKSLKRHLSSRGLTPEHTERSGVCDPIIRWSPQATPRLDQSWPRRLVSVKRGAVASERPRKRLRRLKPSTIEFPGTRQPGAGGNYHRTSLGLLIWREPKVSLDPRSGCLTLRRIGGDVVVERGAAAG